MPYVNGKRFFCDCGVGIFTKRTIGGMEIFACNGCTTEYTS